ncbi:hypothetical protein FRC07_005285 [Ceratobasidium sp. 392]|nr:hypothetical protein FRC07_005285 [Ceratobasidium sp. 392]
MGAAISTPPPNFESLVECRVDSSFKDSEDSEDVSSKIWFNTPPITQDLLDRLDTIRLKTLSHNEDPYASDESLEDSWFELVLYRSWDRSRPRYNLATNKELSWRSHSNTAYQSEDGTEVEGPVFQRGHELLKEIEAGDVIAVRVCAQGGLVNYAIKGEIDVRFQDETAPIVPTTYSVYPYSSIGPCYVRSQDHSVVSKLWFTTPPLDETTIQQLSEVQLFTESSDQGWADDKSWSYSWFELVVLGSHTDTEPLKRNGYELAWRSHANPVGVQNNEILEGSVFDRGHALLSGLLSTGNCIGVRVCTRFGAWRNLATEGRIELRFSEPVTRAKLVKTKHEIQVADKNVALMEAIDRLYDKSGLGQPEVQNVVVDLMNEPMQWDGQYGRERHPLSILSLDGGGVRGLSSLVILKAIMERVKGPNGQQLNPYECFDFIAGTSTGGLIAIMLGRLKMTVQQCIDEYQLLAEQVFGHDSVEKYEGVSGVFKMGWDKFVGRFPNKVTKGVKVAAGYYMYDANKLRDVIQDVINRYGGEGGDATMFDTSSSGCHVAVFACHAGNINNSLAKHFRTYQLSDDKSSETMIWQAARATTAAPAYFESIKLGDENYVDGGLQVNNPILTVTAEGLSAFGKARTIGSLLSIGTGRAPDMALSEHTGIFAGLHNIENLAEGLLALATNSEFAHLNVENLNKTKKLSNEYFRFNAKVDIPEKGDPQFRDKMIGLDDVASLDKFRTLTEKYLQNPDVQKDILKCADQINTLYRQRHSHS